MKRIAILISAFSFVLAAPGWAAAQNTGPRPYGTVQRPTVSPYLNLLRGGSPSANYFLGVVPSLYGPPPPASAAPDVTGLQRPSPEVDEFIPQLNATGHQALFLNYGPFYNLGNAPRSNALNPAYNRGR